MTPGNTFTVIILVFTSICLVLYFTLDERVGGIIEKSESKTKVKEIYWKTTLRIYLFSYFQYFILYFLGGMFLMAIRNNLLHENEYMGAMGMGGFANNSMMNPYFDMGGRKGVMPTIMLISFFFSIGTLGYQTTRGFLNKSLDDTHMYREITTFLPLGTFGLLDNDIAKNWNKYFFNDCVPKDSSMICETPKK